MFRHVTQAKSRTLLSNKEQTAFGHARFDRACHKSVTYTERFYFPNAFVPCSRSVQQVLGTIRAVLSLMPMLGHAAYVFRNVTFMAEKNSMSK